MPDYSLIIEVGTTTLVCTSASVFYRINQVPGATFTLLFGPGDGEMAKARKECLPGKAVKIMLNNKPLFAGQITRQTCDYSPNANTIVIEASHDLQKLKISYRSELYAKKTDQQILSQIFNSHKIPLKTVAGMKTSHEQMVQFNCSDWRFIRARVNACGVLLVPTPEGVKVAEVKMPAADISITPKTAGLRSATIESNNSMLAEGIELSSWDIAKQSMGSIVKAVGVDAGSAVYNGKGIQSLTNKAWQQGYSRPLVLEEQRQAASGRLLMNQLAALRATIRMTGHAAIEPGKGVRLSDFGDGIDGTAIITGVRHDFNNSSAGAEEWVTVIEAGCDLVSGIDAELVPSAPGLHIGIVDANPDGPDENHALNITLPALQLKNTPLKARLSVPFAGEESGFNFYPQKGDEVVVAFFEDDPRFPVILGAMHNPKRKAPKSELDAGIGMVLKTEGLTQRLLLHPSKGLLLEEKNGAKNSQLVFKDGVASLKVSADVDIEAKQNLQLKAGANGTLSGSSGVTIQGSKVELKQ